MDDQAQRLVAQVCAGTDAVVGGPPDAAGRLLAVAMPGFGAAGDVMVAGSPEVELSLSALIAGISGQSDLGGQDDSVLELGFKRLTGPGQTVLVLRAPAGISRSALRYVQHMGRLAPRLVLVVVQSAPLDFMLAEPGFAAIRARLRAAAPIEAVAPARPAPGGAPATLHAGPPALLQAGLPALGSAGVPIMTYARPRRSAVWIAATALGLAAVVGGALLLYGSPFASWGQERTLAATLPLMPAAVPAPLPAGAAVPALAAPAGSHLLAAAPPELVGPSPGKLAASALPPLLPPAAPAMVAALPPLLKPDRPAPKAYVDVPHVEAGRWARARSTARHAREDELARYAGESPYPEPPPVWISPEPRRREMPYLGTYAVDPYGMRVFRYDP